MSYQIIGETIKSATSIKIGDIFKVQTGVDQKGNPVYSYPRRYKENVTSQTYPNFHIIQVLATMTPAGRKRIQLDYLINVQYRVAQNTEDVTNLQQQLDAVGLKLNTELTELNLERPTKVKNATYEKVDGVGQFTFNITVYAIPDETDLVKMQELELTEEVY